MRKKKRFSERPLGERILISVALALSLGLVAAAERDIHHRDSAEVIGSKLLWRAVATNALGALAYLRWGRRSS